MSWQVTAFAAPILFAAILTLVLAGYTLSQLSPRDHDPVVLLFLMITLAAFVWTGGAALKLLHTDPDMKLLFYRVLHVGAAVLPPLFFLFVVAYTDRLRWLRPAVVAGVFALPVIFVVLLFLDPANIVIAGTDLMRNDLIILRVSDGSGFIVFSVYSIGLVGAALVLLLGEARRIGPTYYPQVSLVAIAVLLPLIFSVLNLGSVPPFTADRINLVPTAGAVSAGVLGLLLFRYRLFELPPLAYATATKYSPDPLVVLDRNQRIVHANEHGEDLLARLGTRLGDPLPFDVADRPPDTASNDLVELETDADQPMYYRLFVESLIRGGRHVGWVVVFRDETTQQRQQQQLAQQNEQLEAFADVVSHDLRNPLTVAQARVELAREEFDSDHLDQAARAHDRMDELIEDLLTLAREGERVTETEPVDLDDVAVACWRNVDTPTATIQTRVDRSIHADVGSLQRLLENLIRNAVEHGGESVTVTIGELDDGFYFEDDGGGIVESDRDEIFEPGYSTAHDGTGFGLNIVKQIVDAHGWEIHVTTGDDGGARFEITNVQFAAG